MPAVGLTVIVFRFVLMTMLFRLIAMVFMAGMRMGMRVAVIPFFVVMMAVIVFAFVIVVMLVRVLVAAMRMWMGVTLSGAMSLSGPSRARRGTRVQ